MLRAVVLVSAVAVAGALAQVSPALPEAGAAPEGSPVAKHGALKTSGAKIVDKNNAAVTLRGMSLYWAGLGEVGAGDPYYNDAVIGWLAHDWKASVVRVAIPAAQKDGVGLDNAYNGATKGYADGDSALMVRKAVTVVEACIRRGMYVILDWHVHNKHEGNKNYSAKGAEFLGNMAKRYGQYPNVLFEPFNEPVSDNVETYVNPIITEIRKSSQNIIIVGSNGYSTQPNQVSLPGTNTNIAYSYHFYANEHPLSSHQSKIDAALNAGRAVFVTEFGTTSANGKTGHNEAATNTWITYLEQKNIGWINWEVGDRDEQSAILANGSRGTDGGPWTLKSAGTWARGKILSYNGSSGANYYPATTYSINVTAGEGGTVQKKVGSTVNNGPYSWKNVVTVAAVPNAGWEVVKWTGDAFGVLESMDITVYGLNYNMGVTFHNGGVIKNGHFGTGTSYWAVYKNSLLSPAPSAEISWDESQAGGAAMKITIATPGESPEVLSVFQGPNLNGLKFEQGRKYEVSFEARAASARTMVARASNNRAASATPYLSLPVNLGTTMSQFTGTFNMSAATVANGRLDFDVGGNAAAIYIRNVKVRDIGAATGVSRGAPAMLSASAWSVTRAGSAWQLRGPAEAGATAALYDTRGKTVKAMSAADGLNFGGAGIPAGNYFLVVKNRLGAEVFRAKVVMAK
jgi:endoglucanase